MALTELDYRASATLKERLTTSSRAVLEHLLFRASEVCVRLLTVLVFLTATRSIPVLWYLTFLLMVATKTDRIKITRGAKGIDIQPW